MRRTVGRAAAAIAGIAMLACTGGSGPPEAAPERPATATPPVSPTPEARAPTGRIGLSLKHDGRSVVVATTTNVTLVLGGRYYWRDPVSHGARVDVLALVSDAPEGAQMWQLVPAEPGVAVVRTVGAPACRPATPGCPESNRNYAVTLEIRQ